MRRLLIKIFLLALLLFVMAGPSAAEVTTSEAANLLPDKFASFQSEGPATTPGDGLLSKSFGPEEFGSISDSSRSYRNETGSNLTVEIVRTESDSAAYAFLTRLATGGAGDIKPGAVGLAGIVSGYRILFCKGGSLVQIQWIRNPAGAEGQLLLVSQAFAATLPSGDDDIPVLVQHLPNWQTKVSHAAYAVTIQGLRNIVPNQPVLDALSFEGGTEAVAANYGQSQLVIVEFTTPQFAGDNDQRIWAKIQELKSQNKPSAAAYRRIGNYSVFVFNAPDQKTAEDLIGQVKYEKVVQWLGEDPHLYERLQRYLTQTSAGVLLAVLKSSGLSLLLCLGIGALIGALLFRRRRAQQATLYSDAGGGIRLNLDELTGTGTSRRLLGRGEPPKSDSTQT